MNNSIHDMIGGVKMAEISIESSHDTDQKAFDIFQKSMEYVQDVPDEDIIYHYTSPEGLKGITGDENLWATDINYLNDNSELRYIYQLAENITNENNERWSENFCESLLNQCLQKAKRYDVSNRLLFAYKTDVYVISFSLDEDNLNMWKYYSKTADTVGYNIGFEKDKLVNATGLIHMTYGKVIYDKEKQVEILTKTLNEYESLYKDKDSFGRSQVFQMAMTTLENLGVFFKHPAFVDENEFRIIIRDNIRLRKKGNCNVKYRINKGVFIPYTTLSFLPEAVRSIGISPCNNQSIAEYSVERMLETKFNLKYENFHCSKIPFNM